MLRHELDGLTAIVTGASQGLGRTIACELAARGATVVLVARRGDLLDAAVDEIERNGGQATAFVADVGERDAATAIVDHAASAHGKVDVLVNNAAYEGPIVAFTEAEESELRRALDVNLFGVWHLCQAVVPGMVERQYGRIMNLMGPIPEQPAPFHAIVAASKGAVLGLTRSLAAEVAPFGVTVNALCAGAITGTEMSERMLQGYADRTGMPVEAIHQMMLSRTPQLRFQDLGEVASVAAFLASPAASALTAQSVKAAGGLLV